jgi:hypothetical protein
MGKLFMETKRMQSQELGVRQNEVKTSNKCLPLKTTQNGCQAVAETPQRMAYGITNRLCLPI